MTELREAFQTVLDGDFELLTRLFLGHFVWCGRNELSEAVALGYREVLDTCHVLDGALGSHGAVGNDMGNLFGAVFLSHIVENGSTAIVVKVGIDIGQ